MSHIKLIFYILIQHLTLKFGGINYKIDSNTIRELEDQIVKDILTFRIKFRQVVMCTKVSTDIYYIATNANIIGIREFPTGIYGSFNYLKIDGRHTSVLEGFDYIRVVKTIQSGYDHGKTNKVQLYDL